MDFSLREEQQEVRDLARRILEDHTSNERLRDIEQREDRYEESLWRILAEAGLLGTAIPEKHGGMGFGFETLCLLVQEVGRTVAPIPLLSSLVDTALPIARFGDEEAQKLLPRLCRGEIVLSAAWAEPGNDDFLHPVCRARQENSGWTLQGSKHCVPYAAVADRLLVSAAVEQGSALFLVDPRDPSVHLRRQAVTSGEPQFLVEFENTPAVVLTMDAQALEWTTQRAVAASCALALGIAEKMLEITAAYTSEREQFGVKIATFQAVGHRAADCFIDVMCLRLATQHAVSLLERDEDPATAIQVAKIQACDVLHRVSYAAQHLHGGMGVDRDYHLFRYCLWAKHAELMLGTGAFVLEQLGCKLAERYTHQEESL